MAAIVLPSARIFVNVVRFRAFFIMNKRDLRRQREDRILVAEEEILHGIENQPGTSRYLASCKSPGSFLVCSLAASSKRRSGNSLNKSILNRVRLSWKHRAEPHIANDGS
jgi:hypothetical protein